VLNLKKLTKKINIRSPLRFDEPMARHTSFKVGGPADLYISPRTQEDLTAVYSLCLKENIPHFLLGAGANILVSDRGIRGIVIDTHLLRGIGREETLLTAWAGTEMSRVSEVAAHMGLAGLESFFSMPGSVGGSIWINARCYESSLSDVLEFVEILDNDLEKKRTPTNKGEFGYKKSPFQNRELAILKGGFRLKDGSKRKLRRRMRQIRQDRGRKGHFLYPSAGSFFKNNRSFGMPSGKLIDSLGLKGQCVGGARVSDRHANIIVNTGSATASDILELSEIVRTRVADRYGYELEREIILVGEWEEGHEQP
jgi:UDP-N-acetylmuramate dehydrogenase